VAEHTLSYYMADWANAPHVMNRVVAKLSCKDAARMRKVCVGWRSLIDAAHLDTVYNKTVCRWQRVLWTLRRCAVLNLVRPLWRHRYADLTWCIDLMCSVSDPQVVLDYHLLGLPPHRLQHAKNVLSVASSRHRLPCPGPSFNMAVVLVASFDV
jgi:hypothetical protein